MVTGVDPSPPRFLPSILIAHRVQHSHCSSMFHRVLLTHALALPASKFVQKKKSQRICTSMHSAGLELTKLTYTRLEDNLIRHRSDRSYLVLTMSWGEKNGFICQDNTHRKKKVWCARLRVEFFLFCFVYPPADGGKIKLKLTTLPRIFIRIVCRFNSVDIATQR